jgi:hypothetical protein
MAIKPKPRNRALDVRTFDGADGASYVVFRTSSGSFHTFREVEAKEAARQCGAKRTGTTREMWESIWRAVHKA